MARRIAATAPARHRKLRCAVYTRKSSEEGLEQSFNSLHAQRDACEAFIASQKHEGWVLLPGAYDDGGLSGGSMERPSLRRLIEDVQGGLVDIVVVYKVDRLTRSLADFAKLTELFDAHDASFVSVTQAFNTSTSMGRLTLNVLLSFAQFEREVAGERIRDKIALSKRRGMWMGGLPPLGYDGIDRKLVINEAEAQTVRLIFRRYLEVGSIPALKRSLDSDAIVSKRRQFQDGRCVGGVAMSRGAIYQILRNRLYRGEIAHRGEIHRGEHVPIVDRELWDAVQRRLEDQGSKSRGSGARSTSKSLLAGLVFDEAGHRMTPTHANKSGRRYRYYTSASLVRGGGKGDGMRVPAADLEQLIMDALADHIANATWMAKLMPAAGTAVLIRLIDAGAELSEVLRSGGHASSTDEPLIRRLLEQVVTADSAIAITVSSDALVEALNELDPGCAAPATDDDDPITITVPCRLQRRGKQMRLILGEVTSVARSPDRELIELLRDGRRWFEDLRSGRASTVRAIAKRDRHQVSHVSRTLSLAFLAPDLVEMILGGRQPITLTPERLKTARPLPLDWNEQRALLLDGYSIPSTSLAAVGRHIR